MAILSTLMCYYTTVFIYNISSEFLLYFWFFVTLNLDLSLTYSSYSDYLFSFSVHTVFLLYGIYWLLLYTSHGAHILSLTLYLFLNLLLLFTLLITYLCFSNFLVWLITATLTCYIIFSFLNLPSLYYYSGYLTNYKSSLPLYSFTYL